MNFGRGQDPATLSSAGTSVSGAGMAAISAATSRAAARTRRELSF
jgi:hypothetical protein